MKILQLIQKDQLRGAEIFAGQLATELVKLGHPTDMLCLFSNGDVLAGRFRDLFFSQLQAKQSSRLLDVPAFKRLATMITKGGYSLVQANAGDTLKYAVLSKLMFGWKAKLVYRNANKMSAFFRNGLHRKLTGFLIGRCDHVISVSENCRRDIIDILPALENRSVTIPIGTYDFTHVPPGRRSVDEPVWINVGAFVREKNHFFLLDVFAAYVKGSAKGVLWLVGDGPLMPAVKVRVKQMGLADRVVFFGASRDAVSILKAADVLVMPSLIEGLPGVILEAFSCGVPVVAAKVGGIPEVIEDGATGFCVPEFSVTRYVAVIEKIFASDALRETIVANASRRVTCDFAMPVIAARFVRAYENILRGQPLSPVNNEY